MNCTKMQSILDYTIINHFKGLPRAESITKQLLGLITTIWMWLEKHTLKMLLCLTFVSHLPTLLQLAIYNHWTGLVDWTGGLHWWTGLVD